MRNYTIAGSAVDDLIELIARLQALPKSAAVDIPAYLRKDLLEWLRLFAPNQVHL